MIRYGRAFFIIMVTKVFENIWRIDLPLTGNPLKILNSYYIKGQKKEVVIDTGFRRLECKEALIKGLLFA